MKKSNELDPISNLDHDGIDRRGFLSCMAWVGTGVFWMMTGGIMKSFGMSQIINPLTGLLHENLVLPKSDFHFVQISDTHIGFNKPANPEVMKTLEATIEKINSLPNAPEFIIHTGDLTHLSLAEEFDDLDQSLKSIKTNKIFYVPGEHDVLDNGKLYLERFGKGTKGLGWYSFDKHGVHFIALVNASHQGEGGLGLIGKDQLEWLKKDLSSYSSSTPLVIFAHIPLWSIYPTWGWGTEDSAMVMDLLKKFGSVTVLNGHIHQTIQKIEGSITFHTARSTAFPQANPGIGGPGPLKVPSEKLRSLLGLTEIHYWEHDHPLAITDIPLMESIALQENQSPNH